MYLCGIIVALLCNVLASNSLQLYQSLPKNYQHQSKSGIRYTVSSIEFNPNKDFDTSGVDVTVDINLERCEGALPGEEYITNTFVAVYPEYCVTSNIVIDNRTLARQMSQIIPEADGSHSPCGGGSEPNKKMLERFSCIAKVNKIYVVSHFIEQEECKDCAEDNLKLYSTAVAFDNTGAIVAKYRKTHMYDEIALNAADSAQISTFTSDFGVTFGLVMSFDLMFESPAMELTSNVTEILVPFSWSGIMPFLTPLQILNGWSIINDINLIPGCYLKPSEGYTGCGMFFHGDGGYSFSLIYGDGYLSRTTTLDVTSVNTEVKNDKKSLSKFLEDINFKSENMTEYSAVKLEAKTKFTEIELCHNSLCCQLSYEISQLPVNTEDFHYHFLVFDGVKKHPNGKTGWKTQVCGLVGCSGDNIESCGDMPIVPSYKNETVFINLSLTAHFNSSFAIPTLMTGNLEPFKPTNLTTEEGIDGNFNITLSLEIQYNIHTFGLYSGILGIEEYETDSSHMIKSSFLLLLIPLCFIFVQ